MERFNALGRGAQLMLIAGLLLFIDLFLPWQDFDVGGIADELGVDATFSGWRGFAGVVLGLLTIVMLAWLLVRLLAVNIPLPVSQAMSAAVLGVLVAVFGIIKLLTILGDEQTIWAWIGVVLAILVAVGAYMQVQETGGMDSLRSEATTLGSGMGSRETTSSTAPPAATSSPSEPSTPPPPPPPSEPEASPPPPAAEPEAPADADEPPRGTT